MNAFEMLAQKKKLYLQSFVLYCFDVCALLFASVLLAVHAILVRN